MDPRYNDIFHDVSNQIFKIVFFPDRIYHESLFNAAIASSRYRYNLKGVRSKHDITIMKGEVYFDGQFFSNFLRIEYRGTRLVEAARTKNRRVRENVIAWVKINNKQNEISVDSEVKMTYCGLTRAYQVEIWQNLEAAQSRQHDIKVLTLMGKSNQITRVRSFNSLLNNIEQVNSLELAFRENDINYPLGYKISDPAWDNNYLRTHEEPINPKPNSAENTIKDQNYYIPFQKGWFLQTNDITPVNYENAMMDNDNPERKDGNIVKMRWILQRELGSSLVYFHEVILESGAYEGTHEHIGSEELYYITTGEGIAYMGAEDDPTLVNQPTKDLQIFGLGNKPVKEVPVKPGNIIYTKSGGMHGIRNTGQQELKFVAFGYHTV